MLTAITRALSPEIVNCELTFVDRQPIDFERAQLQHRRYCAALAEFGTQVITLPAAAGLADSVFVEDTAVVFDKVAVIMNPGADSRRGETDLIEPELARLRTVARVRAPATLEGGDILRIGKKVYVGLSRRTNSAGVEQLRRIIDPLGYDVVAVQVSGCLHLKTACTALDDHTIIANPDWVDLQDLTEYEIISVLPAEPWGANVLRIRESLIMNAAFPDTLAMVERRGHPVHPVDLSEFVKAEAGATCLSLIFDS